MDIRPDHNHTIISLYQRGLSVRQIAEATGVSKSTVGRTVHAAGVTRSRSQAQTMGGRRKKAVPANWSFLPLSPGKAWLLGLIYGDGFMRTDGKGVILTAHDRDVIDNVNALLGGGLHAVQRDGRWMLQINSVRLADELHELFGLAPGDSTQRIFPTLGPAYLPHFVRGLLDSDGIWQAVRLPPVPTPPQHFPMMHLRHMRPTLRVGFVSKAIHVVEGLRQVLIEHAGVTDQVQVYAEGKSRWSLRYGSRSAITIGRWIYDFCDSTPALRRESNYQQWAAFA